MMMKCPRCGVELIVREELGSQFRCGSCGEMLEIGEDALALPQKISKPGFISEHSDKLKTLADEAASFCFYWQSVVMKVTFWLSCLAALAALCYFPASFINGVRSSEHSFSTFSLVYSTIYYLIIGVISAPLAFALAYVALFIASVPELVVANALAFLAVLAGSKLKEDDR